MSRFGLGQARHIMAALIEAGVDRDLCWEQESGSVQIHERADNSATEYKVDITVSGLGGFRYAAYDNRADVQLHPGGPLEAVARAVAVVAQLPTRRIETPLPQPIGIHRAGPAGQVTDPIVRQPGPGR